MQQMAFCGGVDRFYPLLAIHNNNGLVYIVLTYIYTNAQLVLLWCNNVVPYFYS